MLCINPGNYISCFSLIHQCHNLTIEGTKFVRYSLPSASVKPCWLHEMRFSFWLFHCPRATLSRKAAFSNQYCFMEKIYTRLGSFKIREGLQLGKAMMKEVATWSSIYISLTDLTTYILKEFHAAKCQQFQVFLTTGKFFKKPTLDFLIEVWIKINQLCVCLQDNSQHRL